MNTKEIAVNRDNNCIKNGLCKLALRTVPTNKEGFCVVYDYAGKADLIKGY